MSLTHVLEVMTGAFAAALLVRALGASRARGRLAAWGVVVALLGGALIAAPRLLGSRLPPWVAALYLTWAGLAPALLVRLSQRAVLSRRYERAARLSRILAWLRPERGMRAQPAYLRALAAIERGETDDARRRLRALKDGPLGPAARLSLLRLERDWAGALALLEPQLQRGRDVGAAVHALRALGELGRQRQLRDLARAALLRLPASAAASVMLPTFAFAGEVELSRELFEGPFARIDPERRQYWLAVAEQAAGREAEAGARLERLAAGGHGSTRTDAEHRLQVPAPRADEQVWRSPEGMELLERMRREMHFVGRLTRRRRRPWLIWALSATNLGVFLWVPPGPGYPRRLFEAGALILPMPSWSEHGFRVFAACFLHFGWLHLVLNLAALLYIGGRVEPRLGRLRTAFAYSVCGPGAFALLALASTSDALSSSDRPTLLVGASAAIMGLFGVEVGLLLRARALESRMGRRALAALALILGAQTAFDLITPEVSMSGHLVGAALGILCGLALAPSADR